jgi:hypothetical protein
VSAVLTIEQIRKVAQQSGARDITKVETDTILTHLLQLMHEKGITEHIAFKGGTMLRQERALRLLDSIAHAERQNYRAPWQSTLALTGKRSSGPRPIGSGLS